jgi:hypothetical protein
MATGSYRPLNRRQDPEALPIINWPYFWARLRAYGKCRVVPDLPWSDGKEVWSEDIGYCLDRPSTKAELNEALKEYENETC